MQMADLLHHYASDTPVFLVLHIGLLCWAVMVFMNGLWSIKSHLPSIQERVFPPPPQGPVRDPWTVLLLRFARQPRPDYAQVRAAYDALFEDQTETLSRIANLVLL